MEKTDIDPSTCRYNDKGMLECSEIDKPQCTEVDQHDTPDEPDDPRTKPNPSTPDEYTIV